MERKIIKLAGIDIGSNAVRIIVKNIFSGESYKDAIVKKTAYLRLPVRLGSDVFEYGKIREEKEALLTKAMTIYSNILDYYDVKEVRACATSAMRSASNNAEVIARIKEKSGIEIDMIDGVEESMLLYETNKYNLPDGKTFLSADLGGGSFQLTLFEGDNLIWTHSYKIGTVRMLKKVVKESELTALDIKLTELKNVYGKDLKLIGSGGNINKLSSLAKEKNLELEDIEKWHDKLLPMSLRERMNTYGLREDRADVIVPASEVYINLMKKLDVDKIYVPKIGLADGIVRKLYEKYCDEK